ncbi:Gfo/Idh/MocA family protein [Aureibacillus halotolerans]|uniref:Putative dehydrogenase n=1 Tax=Aureibacillus halotolerans TaxID=1508390 RepID=A0A4R6U7F6_9BACI|nr:Gfo/Idh/MocA family oxidoreductase [Aureibacillus halotolerans]TDQ41706.1 putative dehydrogenase [Aureibacillus halotolerans]
MNHRVIVVGCGGMANKWVDYAIERTNVSIVALVDVFIENAIKMRDAHNLDVPVFESLTDAIAQTEATLVFDVTIPASHKDVSSEAMRMNLNVFGEKPMAESFEDANSVLALSAKQKQTYSVMQNRRYDKHIRGLQKALDQQLIGPVGAVHADFFLGPHFGGFREAMLHPLIIDMAIHTFDQARLICNADPVSVYCHEFNTPGSWYDGNASAVCIFEMDNGIVFTYRGSWSSIGAGTSWQSEWRIQGSKGTALWNGEKELFADVKQLKENKEGDFLDEIVHVPIQADVSRREGHEGCLDEMFQALEEGRLAETDCTSNIKSMAMVFGAIKSAKEGKKVLLTGTHLEV